ncbi:MAG: hemerythrin domain-containing protein [Acidobacteria bacterium]|nr:hemerythrin domain-containing protein [Acidobacteriota bacterium]
MDPIRHLLDEHALIMNEMAALRAAAEDLAARGDDAVPDILPVLRRIGEVMETRLEWHARKEEDTLFPAMERVIGVEGPTAVMRMEHEDLHGQGRLLRATLRELNEVEHPRIEATREQLRWSLAEGGSADVFRELSGQILQLIDMHFYKEEQILFPMAERLLGRAGLDEVGAAMAAFDEAETDARRCLTADR